MSVLRRAKKCTIINNNDNNKNLASRKYVQTYLVTELFFFLLHLKRSTTIACYEAFWKTLAYQIQIEMWF